MIYWPSSEAFAARRRGAFSLRGDNWTQYDWAQDPVTFHTPGKVAGALSISGPGSDDLYITDSSPKTRELWPASFPHYPAANLGETPDVFGLIAPRMVIRVAQPGPYLTQVQVRATFYYVGQAQPQSAGGMALVEDAMAPFSITVNGKRESNGTPVSAVLSGTLVFGAGLWTWGAARYTPTVTLQTGFTGVTAEPVSAFSFV